MGLNLGDRVRAIRKDLSLTQEQLAGMMGVTKAYLSQLERGQRRWNEGLIEKVADVLDVSTGALMDDSLAPEKVARMSKILISISELNDSQIDAIEHMIQALKAK